MSKPIEEILAPKPVARPRIYAYSIADAAHAGQLKIGQTTRDVKQRIAEQLKTAAIKNFKIELDESAERDDGTIFTDHQVRAALSKKRFENAELEWMRCTVKEVKSAIAELRSGQQLAGAHHETFAMRREQTEAVRKTHGYFHSIWKEDMHAVPRYLWNAKMRFGKTFTAYHLAKKLGAKRVLVVTFKPAVEDAWQTDLESHVDFDGWQYLSRHSDSDPTKINGKKPVVYFGSIQDLLGRDSPLVCHRATRSRHTRSASPLARLAMTGLLQIRKPTTYHTRLHCHSPDGYALSTISHVLMLRLK